MKKKINLIGLSFFVFVCLNAQTPYFYYFNGEKQYFELDTRYVFVSVADKNTDDSIFAKHNAKYKPLRIDIPIGKRSNTNQNIRFWTVLSFEDRLLDEAYLAKLSEIKHSGKDVITAPYFKTHDKDKIGLSNFFYVKLKSFNDTILLKREAEKEYAIIVYQSNVHLWFVLSITEKSRYNAMELANHFYESGLFQYAEPDLLVDDIFDCADDPHFGLQWGLKNIGQSGGESGIDIKNCDAWQLSTGIGITIAVVDQGINFSHPDLSANEHPYSYDSESKTSPQELYGYHGTACAGIIGALRNNIVNGNYEGIAGVAPDCKLMSISTSGDGSVLSREARADGINKAWRNGADVISNSWGWSPTIPLQPVIDAITDAVTLGRNGDGCVIVFSTGNNTASSVCFPGNQDNVIAVGNIARTGNRYITSNYGDDLNVVAPGDDSYSTDWVNGYRNFNGTSAACPHVSGIAALMLSVNPTLKWDEVKDIIESTCQKVNALSPSNPTGYNYQTHPNRPNGTWHQEVGYGLVNAHAAVLTAYFMGCTVAIRNDFVNRVLCGTFEAYCQCYSPLESVEYLWKTSDNIQIVSGQGSNQSDFQGISVGMGWIECWALRYGDIVFVGRKEIEITNHLLNDSYENFSTAGNLPMQGKHILINGTFTINSGHTVTIQGGTVYCAEDAQIIVKPGGKLILDNAKLRANSYCSDQMWQGIVIEENSLNSSPQGIVELINGARIENAVCGIHVKRSLGGGGIVYADNAHFINNQQAVYFAPYISGIPGYNAISNNASYFKNSTFRLDNNAYFSQAAMAQVKLHGVQGIPFTNCTFEDNRTKNAENDYITGIYANASNIKVGNYSPIMLGTSGDCSFSGFNRAIHIINSNTPSQIYASTFTNNHIGIEAENQQDFSIGNCQFEIRAPMHFDKNVGIYLKNTSLYRIANNYFEGEGRTEDGTGILTENSGTVNNFVKNNTLKNLCTACLAIGINANGTNKEFTYDKSEGLVYQCNSFESNDKDIRVAGNSRIRQFQSGSDFTKATGNIFNSSNYNLYNEGDYFVYCYLKNNPIHYPSIYIVGSSPDNFVFRDDNKNSDYCCQTYGYAGDYYYNTWCAKPWDNGDLTVLNDNYITAKAVYNTKKADNAGISFAINWESPDVQHIIERLEMADGDEFTITIQGNTPATDLEKQVVLYYELSNLKQQMDMMCYAALDILATDTAGLDIAQYRTWVGRFNTVESDYLLSDLYIASGEFAEALGILDSMPSKFEGLNLETHQDYLDYFAVVQNIPNFEEGDTIPRSLINELVRLSSKNNFVAIKAYSFGEMLFDDWTENYPRDFSVHPACVCSYDGSSPIQKSMSSGEGEFPENKSFKEKVSENEKTQITIKPNPTTGLLTISIDNGELAIDNIEIYNIVGQVVMTTSNPSKTSATLSFQGGESPLSFGEGQGVRLDVSHLANGMYFITIHSEGQKITKKFVKN